MQPYALTLDKFLDHAAKWHPSAEVVTGRDGTVARIGYADLRVNSCRLSGALLALGLRPGDRLATLAWNSQAHMECWFAAIGVGIVYHTLNPRLSSAHLAAMIHRAENRVLAVSQGLAPLVEDLLDRCPTIEHVIILDEPGAPDVAPTSERVRIWRQDALLSMHGETVPWGGFDENTEAGLCFTSGTTGAPKGVVYTHRSNYLLTLNILQAGIFGITAQDVVLPAVPMFHANGWGLPFAAPAVGAKLVLPSRNADGASIARLIADEQVTVAAGVPTVWLALVDHLEKVGGELPSLKRVLFGGSPVPQALMDRIEDRLGVTVQTSWGMTELSPLGTVTPSNVPVRTASKSGRPSIAVDLLLCDDTGAALPQQRGVEGYLKVRGPSAVERYFGEPEMATDANGWFDTGDLAMIDADGNLSITGRAKDLIKSGGEWINPGEIEAIVGALPGVVLVAVIGRADPKWGERPVLIVETRKGHSVTDEDIKAALSGRVASWWLPDAIVRVSQMPLAFTGKIDKMRLRAEHG
ncbi:AMP-binding protein [Sphingomonas sp. CGMCC 1.13654]|uniref:AMP-binding protein n=2 Tax=Sphingomonas chungangi TaxID=2683589 RepID=A0A838L3U7_9SPHN|nr:AMP-binding protein [Sphingomonas chungangi]MBA2934061.1 AMP-binding protein [Sphingomonas chungangi]MVW57807.1 AMP-binding protein [Sphingomonas chungangi]